MAGLTVAQLEERLSAYLAAESAILTNQRFKINDRELQRAELSDVQSEIRKLNDQIKAQSAASGSGRSRTRYAVPF